MASAAARGCADWPQCATGTPVVLLSTGRTLALQGPALQSAAILVTWFLASEAGNAIADIVFGVQAPSWPLAGKFSACRRPGALHLCAPAQRPPQPGSARLAAVHHA
ncbi:MULTISPECIES: glycoside hydrolase family 3 C-terminal domain-containing protein [unclassified Xanthomonas]|uniref:glycoside hydrolase family 3 C-terminal domain-containing protein n=1 Tax=unclassified Xanthomonas TaxID=2643310 RepID=UPI002B23DE2C|nr:MULTISPECIES: glycoside hydrolase family 3 C-terminal domain-containing protein [unclassified Xanthomonas]MEA9563200.1 glycoside hydrolase family 3 C-terminal domain-containing protein [Xanthomonas sp. WHRI 8932A]MEA9636320.1 glycoside hydrolase family 3 C-terminal domain-containing protein [Xanthomonas sp. WHRI 8812E]